MVVDFTNDPSLFTDVFHELQTANKRFVIIYGGASSSKSFSVHQNELMNLLDADYNILFTRKYSSDIYDSCYSLLEQIAKEWGIHHLFKWNYSAAKREIVNKVTNKRILFRGLDDPAKVKSIVGIKRIVLEEAEQFTQDDFLELNRRARGMEAIQFMIIFNPVLESHWLKSYFFDTEAVAKNTDFIHCTYNKNLDNLTQEDIDQLLLMKSIDENAYRVYALGEWGKANVDRPYCYNFDKEKHVGLAEHKKSIPVRLSFDFNIDPLVCLRLQMWSDVMGVHHVHFQKEYVLSPGDLPTMLNTIKSDLTPEQLQNVMVTGDATGAARQVTQKNNMDAWLLIKRELGISDQRMNVPRSNPKVDQNQILVNTILALHPDLIIDDSMDLTITEIQYTETNQDGKILKKNRSKAEQRADALDCFRYALNTWLRDFAANPKRYGA